MARALQHVEGSLTLRGYSMGVRSLGDRQDRIIGRFHHGGAPALMRAKKEPKEFLSLSPKFQFLGWVKAILILGCYGIIRDPLGRYPTM